MKKQLDNDVIKVLKNLKQFQGEELEKLKINAEEEDEVGGEKKTNKVVNNVLCKKSAKSAYKVIFPKKFITKFILAVHEAYGHIGSKKLR